MLNYFDKYPYSQSALTYAYNVANGHRPGCKEERQACQRFIDDLQHLEGYHYDVAKAESACKFIEQMPHTKGKWAAQKKKLVIEGWQRFIVCNLLGWVDKQGNRRFRKAYLKIPRKNGWCIHQYEAPLSEPGRRLPTLAFRLSLRCILPRRTRRPS